MIIHKTCNQFMGKLSHVLSVWDINGHPFMRKGISIHIIYNMTNILISFLIIKKPRLSVVVHTHNSSTKETKAGGFQVQIWSQPEVQSKRPCLKKTKTKAKQNKNKQKQTQSNYNCWFKCCWFPGTVQVFCCIRLK
jgi:hypothetical protein